MKHLNLITLALLILLTATLQGKAQQFTLTGKITGQPDAPVFISYTDNNGKTITDSAIVKNGEFNFKGNVNHVSNAHLYVSHTSKYSKVGKWSNQIDFFIEPTLISVEGDYSDLPNFKFTGSKSQKEYEVFKALFKPTSEQMDAVQDKYLANNAEYIRIAKIDKYDARLKSLDHTLDSLNDVLVANQKRIRKQFITENPKSIVSAYELNSFRTRFKIDEVTSLYKSLSLAMQNSYYGKQVKNLLAETEQNSGGRSAKEIESVDINGKALKLSDLKGKYVILDFWGSWCAPCRASTPHLKQLFAKYNKSGLEVIAIAVDDKPKDWKEAVQHDGTFIWHNIMETKTADQRNEITDKYAVKVFPTKILIDKNGVIAGRYDGGDVEVALDKKLAEIFKAN